MFADGISGVDLLLLFSMVAIFGLAIGFMDKRLKRDENRRRSHREEQIPSLEARLEDLGDLMRSSALVLEEVQAELHARIALAERAKLEAEEAERLADLNEAQRYALARLVRAELATEVDRAGRKSLRHGLLTNLLFFVLGIGASLLTTFLARE